MDRANQENVEGLWIAICPARSPKCQGPNAKNAKATAGESQGQRVACRRRRDLAEQREVAVRLPVTVRTQG